MCTRWLFVLLLFEKHHFYSKSPATSWGKLYGILRQQMHTRGAKLLPVVCNIKPQRFQVHTYSWPAEKNVTLQVPKRSAGGVTPGWS